MTQDSYLFPPPPVASAEIAGDSRRFPVNRIFCVGRNYLAHAIEMGFTVDKSVDPAFYFIKSNAHLIPSGSSLPYAPRTNNLHYEMELVVAIGKGGRNIDEADAHQHIFGYACGFDMTRRDLQYQARDKGRPWDTGKNFEGAAVLSPIVPMPEQVLEQGAITLQVNGEQRQSGNLNQLIWNIREVIADLSRYFNDTATTEIYTGTPEGVGPVQPGDQLHGEVEGVGSIALRITAAA